MVFKTNIIKIVGILCLIFTCSSCANVDTSNEAFEQQSGNAGSVWLYGDHTPSPSIGENGDFYFNYDNCDVFVKENFEWKLIGNIKGNDGLTGQNGTDGKDGQNGLTPFIGENGNWWIGDKDTGVHAQGNKGENGSNGIDGLSSYEIYLKYFPGYRGSEEQRIKDLSNNTLKAKVSFVTNSHEKIDDIYLFKGESLSSIDTKSHKFGFIFENWYLDADLEEPLLDSEFINEDLTLYAKYTSNNLFVNYIVDNNIYFSANSNLDKDLYCDDPKIDGYVFAGWYLDNKFLNKIDFSDDYTGTLNLYAKFEKIISNIPVIDIKTENSQDIVSKDEYVNSYITISNADEIYSFENVFAEIKCRGNSTFVYPKKPYKIKFDKKQSLFGKEKNKSWVLLADYLDPSCLHNFTAFNLTNYFENISYSPLSQHVVVYINDDYKGLYLLTEDPNEKSGRVDIEYEDDYIPLDSNEFNFLVEFNGDSKPTDDDAVENETYFMTNILDQNLCIEIKYPEKEMFSSDELFEKFISYVKEQVNQIFESSISMDYSKMINVFDEDSLIDYILLDQLMGEKDHFWRSFKFYKRVGEKIKFGPIWDYDYCLNTNRSGSPNNSEGNPQVFFNNKIKELYASTDEGFKKISERWKSIGITSVNRIVNIVKNEYYLIKEDLYRNNELWYENDSNLYENNYNWLIQYLLDMKELLCYYYK